VSAGCVKYRAAYDADCREHLSSESIRIPSPHMGLGVCYSLTHLASQGFPNVAAYRSMSSSHAIDLSAVVLIPDIKEAKVSSMKDEGW